MRKVLIIGASSAIAQATAKLFAAQGDSLCLIGRSADKLSQIAADLKVRGAPQVSEIVADLNDFAQHETLMKQAVSQLKGLDLVLVAHGTLDDQTACEKDYSTAEACLKTNFLSVVSLLTPVANFFEQQRYGCIAVISSVAGDRGRQSNYVYGTAKGAVNLFLQGLRNRLHKANVHVLTIKPGFVDTPMTAQIAKKGALWAQPEQIAEGINQAILKRKDSVYLPWFWRIIMGIIIHVPEAIFKRLKL